MSQRRRGKAETPDMRAETRLETLRNLLREGSVGTQEEVAEALLKRKFSVTQATVSRDLRRLGAVKMSTPEGSTVYRLPSDAVSVPAAVTPTLKDLILNVTHNGSLIVMRTSPGSASLIALHLDAARPEGVLGTIAGDDTIFIAPVSVKSIEDTLDEVLLALGASES